ncbi:two-component sensor histidine kinase [Streptomyces sp. NBRC 14336]|uniref:sensor histidine kinase n=1 Tax=Streptomyces sp. NBRC 14336 TaxID=3030992 RepID=UPI0024A52AE0|nr:HAMP domain-containing sensor histidine kinase [Streptomyces sp. NBRC 14336]WBO81675.1 HAMP domain-containing histidine kinase [Streptomyces sp. SBE_14.2]GLW50130.1 two-component sensor histidine kinase [Streptomyces sp. NBRC 14336]
MTRRLLLSYLSLTLLVLLALEVPLGYFYARGELSRFEGDNRHVAEMLAGSLEDRIERRQTKELKDQVAAFARETGSHVVVVGGDGRVLADSHGTVEAGTDLSAEPDIAAAFGQRHTSAAGSSSVVGGETLDVTVPNSYGANVRCVVRVAYPMSPLASRIHGTWTTLGLIGFGVLVAVALIALALARWVTRPVRALECATAELADGSVKDLPAITQGPPELRRLATTFARTATRLQHLLHAQRAFASEASHQLKTPLTALRLRLENFEPYLDPRAHDSLDEAMQEVERLGRMVQGLLALARLENSASTPEATALGAVVADRAAIWSAFAAEHQVHIAVTGQDAGEVWALPGALEQVVDNLLSNALRVSPPGGTITLATMINGGTRGSWAELHVIDEGPGMTPEERQRAFDRFWRASSTYHDGTGLGLPIVQQLVRAGGGDVVLDAAPGGGLDAVVRLRVVAPQRPAPSRGPRATARRAGANAF